MKNMVVELLSDIGPCLSTDLAQQLIKNGFSPEAARKRVSRTGNEVKRLGYLPFPHSARFMYLQKQYGSEEYWSALKQAIVTKSPSYGSALASILQRDGILPSKHFEIVCGAPIKQLKHLSPETILNRFKQANIIEEIDVPGIGLCIVMADLTQGLLDDVLAKLRARLIAEDILLKSVKMWARNLGLVSYDKVAYRGDNDKLPRVGTFAWDLTGPSYLAPMVDWKTGGKLGQGFIACDVLLSIPITEAGIGAFLKKCETLRQLKRVGRCLQIFVANSYTKEAFTKAKQAGVIPATIDSLFGKEVSEGLIQLTELLKQAATAITKPEVFEELFRKLGHIEGVAINLRGPLFELIVAELIRYKFGQQVAVNQMIYDERSSEKAEVDVLAVQPHQEVLFIECKGYQPSGTVSDEDVERWLKTRVPFIRRRALCHPDWKDLKHRFELWTTGDLSSEATAMLDKAAKQTKKYIIGYKNASAVYEFAKQSKNTSLLKTLNEHFFDHPFATIEKAAAAKLDREKRTQKSKN